MPLLVLLQPLLVLVVVVVVLVVVVLLLVRAEGVHPFVEGSRESDKCAADESTGWHILFQSLTSPLRDVLRVVALVKLGMMN